MSIDIKKLLACDRRSLAKAITLIESTKASDQEAAQKLMEEIMPHTGMSIRIGITGIPGVGKSTFIEAFGLYLISKGHKVAVLAVDPTSPVNGGSILGDKTRMEELSQKWEAFIRPSPSSGTLGGVANKTREAMLLCEAAGFDVILIETVGVGQSEYEVASMVDFFQVLMLPNAGDELQGIKKGILELADAVIINKADGASVDMANVTASHYLNAFHLLGQKSFWEPRVLKCSALENRGIPEIWEMITTFRTAAYANGEMKAKRARQNAQWMWKLIREMIDLKLKQNPKVALVLPKLEEHVIEGQTTPFLAAKKVITTFFK